ncbi:unnamed protein product [Oikopleura dioica]|uniref:non-specific serine/threonine protein kinase n=2 Tax=Oikopleura dioica TaxID=34765 RepID=E4WRP7_OIKDI|nr:unnamed protein product [Oikopleura dioica]
MNSEPNEKVLNELLYDKRGKFNVDVLLDCVIALYNDCNAPAIKANSNIKNFIQRLEPFINKVQNVRPRISDYQKIKLIGRGAFGEVQLCRHKTTKKVCAMKILSKTEVTKRSDTAFFWEERDIMATTNSPWVVKMYEAFQDKKHLYLVMEFMPGGDLVNVMENYEFPEKWAIFYTAEAVLAINAIHEMGYIHRDIKPENMLLDAGGHLKIADFGTCMKMDAKKKVRSDNAVGTPDYISPEVLQSQGRMAVYGREVDFWSIGVVLYEMLYGETPFYSDGLVGTYSKILDHQNSLKFPDDLPKNNFQKVAQDLIRNFLTSQESRLGARGIDNIKKHAFFHNDEWKWDNLRESVPPYNVEITSEIDTKHFDDIEEKNDSKEAFAVPKTYLGNHLSFVGFSYSDSPKWLQAGANINSTSLNSSKPTLNHQQSLPSRNSTSALTDSRTKELEAQLREKEKDLRNKNTKIDQIERQKSDVDGRCRELEQKIRKIESVTKESSRSQEENLKKIFTYEAELSSNKSKVRDLTGKYNSLKTENVKLRDDLKNERDRMSSSQSREHMRIVTLESELKQAKFALTEIKENSDRDAKRLRSELDMVTRRKQALEQESQLRKRKIEELNGDLTQMRDSNMKAARTEASKQRMSLEEEAQKLREAMRDLEDKCTKSEFDNRQKEDRLVLLERDNADFANRENEQKLRSENISRENHELKIQLEQARRDHENRIRTESRQKSDQFEAEIGSLTELLEREKKKSETLEKQLGELHDQHETQQYFATLYKSQVREKKDELEDEKANIEALNGRIQQLEQEKAKMNVAHMKMTEERQQRFNQELDRLANESSGISHRELEDSKSRIRELEQALFNANDSYEEINRENEMLQRKIDELDGYEEHYANLQNQWHEEKTELEKKLSQEILLKKQSVNKLVQVMTRKGTETPLSGKNKKNVKEDLKKAERKLKDYEVAIEDDKRNHINIVKNKDREIEDLRDIIQKESANLEERQMENEALKMELETARKNLEEAKASNTLGRSANLSISTMSLESGRKEGWLEIPSARGISSTRRDGGWVKVFVILSEDRLFFYANMDDYQAHKPKKIIELSKFYHVRAVTRQDAFRAKEHEIPRMFQIMYGEQGPSKGDPNSKYAHKFLNITYRTPTECDLPNCQEGQLWGIVRAPQAVACQKCPQKYHACCVQPNSPAYMRLPPCRGVVAEEMLVLAPEIRDQNEWLRCLLKKIEKTNQGNTNNQPQFNRHSPMTTSIKSRLKQKH